MGGIKKPLLLKILFIFIVFFALNIFVQRFFHVNFRDLSKLVSSFGIFAPIAYSILLFLGLSVPFNPISDYLVVNLAAFLFPPAVSVIFTFLAHTMAITVNYIIARKFGWRLLSKIISKVEDNHLEKLSKKITLGQIFWMRWILPLTAVGIDIVSYSAGLAKLPFVRFYIVSMIPWTVLNILFFYFTGLIIDKIATLFFIPGLLLVLIPVGIYFVLKKTGILSGRKDIFDL